MWAIATFDRSVPTGSHPCQLVSGQPEPPTGPMPLPEPFRGEVWDVDFAHFGLHPAVVLSINPVNARLGLVAVIPVTGKLLRDGPAVAATTLCVARVDRSAQVRLAGTAAAGCC